MHIFLTYRLSYECYLAFNYLKGYRYLKGYEFPIARRVVILKPWSTDDYLRDNCTPTIQSDPVLTNSHETRSYRALKSQCDYILERHLWVIIKKIVSYYQMIFLLVMLFGDIRSQYLCCTLAESGHFW